MPERATAADTPRLIVDARPLVDLLVRDRGIGRYVAELLITLHASGTDVTAAVANDDDIAAVRERGVIGPVEVLRPDLVRRGEPWWIATAMFLGTPAFDPVPTIVTGAGCRVAAILYDVIPFRHPERYQPTSGLRAFYALRAAIARSVDLVLPISEFSARTATSELRLDARRVRVIGSGVSDRFAPGRPNASIRRDLGVGDSTEIVVAVTGADDRKNMQGLLRAWAQVVHGDRGHRVLVAVADTPPSVLRAWEALAEEVGCRDAVVFAGHLPDEQMVSLLRSARLAIMPSFDEGFGLPALEAAACGIAVITSDTSALPEVLDQPESTFAPDNIDAMATAIERTLTDEPLRARLVRAGLAAAERWTWPRVAAAVTTAIDDRSLPPRASTPRRPQVALVGPFAGSPSGIGSFNESVVRGLGRQGIDITCFVETAGTAAPAGRGRWPARALGGDVPASRFDHVVASVGSSPHHMGGLAAVKHGAHVWMHEPSLLGLHIGRAHLSRSPAWSARYLREQVIVNEGPDAWDRIEALGPGALVDPEAYRSLGIRLVAQPLRRARSVIVSSVAAADVVLRAHPTARVLVLPLAFPPAPVERGDPPDAARIVVLGWLGANKQSARVLDVLAHLDDSTVVDFVGPQQPLEADALREEAARRGFGDRVRLHGRLEAEALEAVLGAARVGLQLRQSDGEMSAAITDLTARGVPVVTTLGTTAIYGRGIAAVLPSDSPPSAIAAAVHDLLHRDDAWTEAARCAVALARSWSFDDLGRELLAWLDRSGRLPPGTVEVRGPAGLTREDRRP